MGCGWLEAASGELGDLSRLARGRLRGGRCGAYLDLRARVCARDADAVTRSARASNFRDGCQPVRREGGVAASPIAQTARARGRQVEL
eukprot:6629282-Alexandrium_andersonii.AAC.1